MANEVEVKLSLLKGKDEITGKITGLQKQASSLQQSFSTALGVFGGGAALAGISAVGSALKSVTDSASAFLSESIAASKEQEAQLNRLNVALAQNGEFTRQASQDFQNFASAIQNASTVGDEVVIGQLALAKSLGATNDQAKLLVQAAVDVSAALGIGFNEAAESLSRTLSGSAGQLGRVVPGLRDLSEEALKSGKALELVAAQFAGAGIGQIQTFSGALIQTENAFSDLQETVGDYITKSPEVIALIKGLGLVFNDLNKNASENRAAFQSLIADGVDLLIGSISGLASVLTTLNTIFKNTADVGNFFADTLLAARETVLELAQAYNELRRGINNFLNQDTSKYDELIAKQERSIEVTRLARTSIQAETNERQKNLAIQNQLIESFAQNIEEKTKAQLELSRQANEEDKNSFLENLSAKNAAKEAEIVAEENKLITIEELRAAFKERELENAQIENEAKLLESEEEFQQLSDNLGREAALRELARAQEIKNTQGAAASKKAIAESIRKSEEDNIFAIQKYSELSNKQRLANIQATFGTISTLQKSGNKELFAVGKAAAIASATVDGFLAVQKALASAPPPLNFVLAAAVGAATAANIAGISSQQPPAFQDGGIVPGNSFSGDRVNARVNSGELILNRSQQENIAGQLSGGGLTAAQVEAIANRPIIIQIDGREIARTVRNEVNQGFRVA